MHRFLLSRVYSSRCQACKRGITTTLKVWEEIKRFCPSSKNYQLISPETSLFISTRHHPPFFDRVDSTETSVSEIPASASYKVIIMDPAVKNVNEKKAKRVRKFSSPLRPSCSKKKAKGCAGEISSSAEPLLICLDDIPLPSNSQTVAKSTIPSFDFIPLPASPPPLPPPLPTPPPPPDHSEMDEILEDFFVIDATASGTLFPIPLPPSYVLNRHEDPRAASRTSGNATDSPGEVIEPDEVSVVCNSDCLLPDQFKNINLVDISKESEQSPGKSADTSQVDIVFEGHWPWVVKSTVEPLKRKKQQLLRGKKSPIEQQVRNCHHNANRGLKPLEKSPEPEIVSPVNTSQPDIITLDPTTSSLLDRMNPEFIRFNVSQDVSLEDADIITLDSPTKKERKSKKLKKKARKEKNKLLGSKLDDEIADHLKVLRQQASSSSQNMNVVDPDIVDIDDDSHPISYCTKGNNQVNVEVVDIDDSDDEVINTPSLLPQQNLNIADAGDSDKESVTSNSNQGGQGVDISTDEFIALGKARLQSLENSEIDLDDEVLEQRSHLEALRKWHTTRLGEEVFIHHRVRRSDTVFTLLSYNVLAQQLLTDNKFLYSECHPSHLEWKYRWALLQYEIQDLDPDIILFQEVQASHYYSHFLPWLTFKGYNGVYKKRTGDKCDGCAIFFKTNKFSLVESCSVEYLQPRARKVLDRDNIGLVAKLASVTSPESQVCVATTHFLYNPKRHDVKLAQAILLLTELDRICYRGEKNGVTDYCPLIITGDFNSEPHSALLDLFKEGRLRYEGLSSRTLNQHGTAPYLEAELIPRCLGITDRCQHSVLAQSRFLENRSGQLFSLADKRKIEESLIRLENSSRVHQRLTGAGGGSLGPVPTGWYSHSFHFNSVYRHYTKRAVEATTFHNKWTSVDYVLYSRIYSQNRGQAIEGALKLLARYGLLTGQEAKRFAPLPSAVCPSDHFPLAAQFLLQGK
ncbi:uncharacterized protein LOC135199540 [Macrobrachium nipponense]|uniref:uncharacterized protein LOC135199540 n=1 Tax=Macrobrachium nipponense TaxID=159736 RepID=UPI0030C836FB